jgi:hypothetical protein
MKNLLVNVTLKDVFNAQTGKGFKDAGNEKISGLLTGYAVTTDEGVNAETGEIEEKEISLMVVDGNVYSGESKVIKDRLSALSELVSEDEIKENGVKVQFDTIKAGRGTATTFILL